LQRSKRAFESVISSISMFYYAFVIICETSDM